MNTRMEFSEHIDAILAAGAGVAGTVTAWVQGQRSAKGSHLDNVEKAIKIWEDTSTRLQSSLGSLEDDMVVLKKNHIECEESKRELCEKVMILEQTMHIIIGTPTEKRKPMRKGGATSDQ